MIMNAITRLNHKKGDVDRKDESKKNMDKEPYWIIDGYYFVPNHANIDNSIIMKKEGEKLVSITDEEYLKILNRFKSKIIEANSNVNIT